MSKVRMCFFIGCAVVIGASLTHPWVTAHSLRLVCGSLLWLAWVGALLFALAATYEAWRFSDQPYFSTACWFGWAALTVALLGPVLTIPAWLLTTLIVAGWVGAGFGLQLELARDWTGGRPVAHRGR